ncbi:MAG: choice-of-anchor tandem repeat GloVer-containing protein [Terriglobales bacterium]
MKRTTQPSSWISGASRRAAGSALVLLTALAFAFLPTKSVHAQGFSYSAVHSFGSTSGDGVNPAANFAMDAQGNLYSTTAYGGAFGYGTVYEIAVTGQEKVLYNFTGIGGDGATPQGTVLVDTSGNLYGSTEYGGDYTCSNSMGCGTVFKLDTAGTETVLYTFAGTGDGANPVGGIVMDAQHNLYGGAIAGGKGGSGVVYKVDPSGVETVVSLLGFEILDAFPFPGVFMESGGNLYLTNGLALFELTAGGNLIGLFSAQTLNPGIATDGQGNFYAAAKIGGFSRKHRPIGSGSVFKVDSHGNVTTLYEFCPATVGSFCPDGAWPEGGVVIDSAGNLYGTTSQGGKGGNGLVFMIDPAGNETVLHNFAQGRHGLGYRPLAPLAINGQGSLYGTTYYGGDSGGPDGAGIAFDMLASGTGSTTSLTSSPNPSTSGEAVTFTAVISGAVMPADGDTVSFMKGKTLLGTGTVSGGSASFTISTLKGATTVTADFGGDLMLSGSSGTVKQVVKKVKQ